MRGILLGFFLICVTMAVSISCRAQELPRRGFLGIKLENLTDDARRVMGIEDVKGVLINGIIPNSTASEAGFRQGDVLLSINGTPVSSPSEAIATIGGLKAGEPFRFDLLRDKKKMDTSVILKTFPEEHYPDLDVLYSAINSVTGTQRIIITKPKNIARMPVVMFIGGIGCYSLDYALDTSVSEVQLLNLLSRAGYMCVRVEKPGVGDDAKSCKPCSSVSFTQELDGYVQAALALKKRDDVDSNAIFIFGHSMGGVMAPLVAQKTNIKGIISYGTIGSNFLEYLMKTRRTVAQAYDMSPEETDDYIKEFCECAGYYFVDKMTTAEAAKKDSNCRDYLSVFDDRSRAYNDEMYAFNFPGLWKPFGGKALLLWGGSDFISSEEDQQIIASTINHYHNGNAEFEIVKNADHGMHLASSFQEAHASPGPYNPEVGKTVLAWLQKQ
jgi:pimeloyl-ACP methyl ester carboxylesterase